MNNAKATTARTEARLESIGNVRYALRKLRELFPDVSADEFGPLKLKAVRESMIRADWSRTYVNGSIGHIKRMFRWGASEELISGSVYQDLQSVGGLKKGRSGARETRPVQPIELEIVNATLPQLLAIPADMVRVQLLTGASGPIP